MSTMISSSNSPVNTLIQVFSPASPLYIYIRRRTSVSNLIFNRNVNEDLYCTTKNVILQHSTVIIQDFIHSSSIDPLERASISNIES